MTAAPWVALPLLIAVLAVGVYVTAVVDELLGGAVAGVAAPGREALSAPVRRAALLLRQSTVTTERPDATLWLVAPAAYAALAAAALAVVPFAPALAVADVRTGIVVFGAAEVLAIVAVFLHGWSPNSALPLLGGYRFVAAGLSFLLLSMFVLIAAALPAESLSVGAIVESQRGVWNIIRQPLGLPLFLVVALGVTFWGPLNLSDGTELAGGTSAESSGPARLAWELARRAMLVAYAFMAASVFAGGYLGPLLPGLVWLALKSLTILLVLLLAGHVVRRLRAETFVTLAWTLLLPLSFADLAIAGAVALA